MCLVGRGGGKDSIAADVILSQSPQAGSPVDPGSTIAVNVSAGPPQVAVPDLGGRIVGEAASALQSAGLQRKLDYVVDPNAPLGTVMKQDPAPAAQVK